MGKRIVDLLPDAATLLHLESEELAGVVLEVLNSMHEKKKRAPKGPRMDEFVLAEAACYPADEQYEVRKALVEAWTWIHREGLIAPEPPEPGTHVIGDWDRIFVTRKGQRLRRAADVQAYREGSQFPKHLMDPILLQKAWPLFLRGDYETSVFQAFKQVEVSVRDAAQLTAENYGVSLMRSAFSAESGPLADRNQPKGEQEAVSHLFAGAIGTYKNPSSHRNVDLDDPQEAFEALLFASHLLRLVARRVRK